jgi:hypothetical protein
MNMKVVYVAPLFLGSTANYRLNAIRRLGLDVLPFDTDSYFPFKRRGLHSLWRRLCWGPPGGGLMWILCVQRINFDQT